MIHCALRLSCGLIPRESSGLLTAPKSVGFHLSSNPNWEFWLGDKQLPDLQDNSSTFQRIDGAELSHIGRIQTKIDQYA